MHTYSDYPASSSAIQISILIALMIHGLLILGVSFDIASQKNVARQALDIILVKPTKKSKPAKDPDFLAQTSQEAGGEKTIKERPTAPPSPPAVIPKPKPAPELKQAAQPKPVEQKKKRVITATKAEPKVTSTDQKKPAVIKPKPNISQLLASTQQEINRLTADLDRRTLQASRRERTKYISASTQEINYASYLDAWRKKVERIGNLNYPDEAKTKKLYGNLLLDVVIRASGELESVRIQRSSGHKILDDAAVRIVKLAAPFAAFPPSIKKDVDFLHITRTWQFINGDRLSTKN